MDFRVSSHQATLAEGVRDYLAGTHGVDVLRGLDGGQTLEPAIWQGLVDMGLPGLLVPEAQGGLGLSLLDAVLIATELGRACLAGPLIETALIAPPLLAAAGGQEALLQRIAAGEAKIAAQHPVNPWVSDLAEATHLLAADGEVLRLGQAPADIGPLQSVDPLRRLYDPVAPSGMAVGSAVDLLDLGALIASAQLLGLGEAMLAMSTAYAGSRTQFGQPIGRFQAIKHHLATAAVKLAFARPVVQRAAMALADGLERAPLHISHAKVAAADAAWLTGETAIQVHGAMGYTYEADLHFWMKRSWALTGAWGDRAFHLRRIDDALLGGTMPAGPEHGFA